MSSKIFINLSIGNLASFCSLAIEKSGDQPKISLLGRLGSERHRQWETAISRQEAIAELEQQL